MIIQNTNFTDCPDLPLIVLLWRIH